MAVSSPALRYLLHEAIKAEGGRTFTNLARDVELDVEVAVSSVFHKVWTDSATHYAAGIVETLTDRPWFESSPLNSTVDASCEVVAEASGKLVDTGSTNTGGTWNLSMEGDTIIENTHETPFPENLSRASMTKGLVTKYPPENTVARSGEGASGT